MLVKSRLILLADNRPMRVSSTGIAPHFGSGRFVADPEAALNWINQSDGIVQRLLDGTGWLPEPLLQRIAAVLDEDLLVCFQRTADGEIEREFLRP